MRRLILLGFVAVMILPAGATRRVTVAQLVETLAAAAAEHRADAEVARQLGNMELSQRLTKITLDRIAGELAPQPRTALAIQLLADQSAFLDPPPDELPATGQPDAAEQKRLLDSARGYVLQTLTRLPNFFATRTTNRFDDTPRIVAKGDWPVHDGLHLVGTASRQITFRDGKELEEPTIENAAAQSAPKAAQETGLRTWGEFGPELGVVLTDTTKGTVTWSHWERTSAGLAAVFHYLVPRAASHYTVDYCCVVDEQFAERRPLTYGNRTQYAGQTQNLNKSITTGSFRDTPGYHGSLSIDPATGAVLRITLDAELKKGSPLLRAASVVQYGEVRIGDQGYICPIRSLAVSMTEFPPGVDAQRASTGGSNPNWTSAVVSGVPSPVLLVNETSFTQYHRLGSTMRVLTGASAEGSGTDQTSTAVDAESVEAAPTSTPQDNASAQQAQTQVSTNSATTGAPALGPSEPAAPIPTPVAPEISMSESPSLPAAPANAPSPRDNGYSLKLTSRLVDVGVVVYDKKGHPVTDLKPDNFKIYDNGHEQDVRFSQAPSALQSAQPAPAEEEPNLTFANRAPDPVNLAAAAPRDGGGTILLIDESHIAWSDMNNVRGQLLKFLGTAAPHERVGLYTMNSRGFRVLTEITADRPALIARLKTFAPTAQSVSTAEQEETRNRQHIDEVLNVSDLNYVNGNLNDVPDGATPVDPQLLSLGSNPARASLVILAGVARHLAAIQGHKNVVWISSDNVFADWEDQAVGIDKNSKTVDGYALRAQEAMNDAHAAVYPFDVSQLETAATNADLQHAEVELTPAAQDMAALGGGASTRDANTGRMTAEMHQNLHPIQETIQQLAQGTGGRAIRRSGDLASALSGIVEDGRATYELSFSPQGQADDQYHSIKVKLSGRRGLTLRYRSGYFFAKEPASLKERFQQAVWRPLDVNEIAITANIASLNSSGSGASVHVNIAAGDLGLQQQADRWMDKLDIFFIQRDDAGVHANVEGETLGMRLKSSTYQALIAKGIPFERAVVMQSGMASLRVVVVDENSGRIGSITIPSQDLRTIE